MISYMVKVKCGMALPLTLRTKNWLFIHEYVGESVSTCLREKRHVNSQDKHGMLARGFRSKPRAVLRS